MVDDGPAGSAGAGHLNLISFWSDTTRWADRGEVHDDGRILLCDSGIGATPAYNVAFRRHAGVAAADLIEAADDLFGPRGQGYTVKVRDRPDDEDLRAACRRARLVSFGPGHPQMVLPAPAPARPAPPARSGPDGLAIDGLQIDPVASADDLDAFVAVLADAYGTYGTGPEVVGGLFGRAGRALGQMDRLGSDQPGSGLLLARRAGRPVGAALAHASAGVGGLYWVAAVPSARQLGVGRAVSRAAGDLLFAAGAAACTLQASPMAEGIYRRLGYQTIYRYRTYTRGFSPA